MPPPTRASLKKYRRVTVMGLGLFGGGAGAARYFANLGARVTVTDAAPAEKLAASVASLGGLGIKFALGGHHADDFVTADLVVANQAVRPDNHFLAAARAAGVAVATETGLALGLCRSPWVGVTGSSGKSTTASLLAEMLRCHDSRTLLGGNIGGDLLTRVEGLPEDAPLVVELSSFQLTYLAEDFANGRIRPPDAAVVTNIAPNHLDWHRDMDDYVAAKRTLLRHLHPRGCAVLNAEDRTLRGWFDGEKRRIVASGIADAGGDNACFVDGDALALRLDGGVAGHWALGDFRLLGRHNLYNAVQAAAAAYFMSRNAGAVAEGLASFAGLPHRLEVVATTGGRTFVNDSKSTTPEAARTALAAIDVPKVLIAGGYDKQSPFDELGADIQRLAYGLVLVGEAAPRLRSAVLAAARERPAAMGELPILDAGGDFNQAVVRAYRLTPEGGAVLLSPACASWGMFSNYEERGRAFQRIAVRLADVQ